MPLQDPEVKAQITADDLAEIFGVADMTDAQRKAVDEAIGTSSAGGTSEATTKDRAARPMSTQRAARTAFETRQRDTSDTERAAHSSGRPPPRRP